MMVLVDKYFRGYIFVVQFYLKRILILYLYTKYLPTHMENTEPAKVRPSFGQILKFDHLTFWVGNAKQAASFYTSRFGFEYLSYKGLQNEERKVASHVIRNHDNTTFVFCSPYTKDASPEMNAHLVEHGDGVKDIALTVENTRAVYEHAIKNGGISVREPYELTDENGTVVLATIQTYGDTTHTFVERQNYKGSFLPGYRPHHLKEYFNTILPKIRFEKVDHIVGNQPDLKMESAVQYYEKTLQFHRFWSVDDSIIHTSYSSLRSIVVADFDQNIKMPLNEPANGKRKSQIQEYVDYYNGAGVQHIALNTNNIIQTVEALRERGIQFLTVPESYYELMRKHLANSEIKVVQDLDILQKYKILIDYDQNGYLLQIFTKPVEDRPTLFFQIIQRRNHEGFGAGNFKSLFEAIELEQGKRGNL